MSEGGRERGREPYTEGVSEKGEGGGGGGGGAYRWSE